MHGINWKSILNAKYDSSQPLLWNNLHHTIIRHRRPDLDNLQTNRREQLAPLALLAAHTAVLHHVDVHEGAPDGGVGRREDDLDDQDLRSPLDEGRDGVFEDRSTGVVRPVVEDVAEDV